ncbi:speckle-type POZ protein B-like [Belonocnema kinseyi]|uniref:speckle-type POZ protein B-like n=1 Tax=Belonocnema kinseyi TaxID=2817044 RepID=UPI00143D6594|nr:speckle-type POZ protein B-like [Belonocnema kinseyi]
MPEHVYGKISSQLFESNDFLQDMAKFYVDDQNFQDVKITVQEKIFGAHKAVLAARSKVFAVMFTNEVSEKCNSLVEIKDMMPEVVEKMLSFIYIDKVEDSELKKFAPEILAAAEKYNLQSLKKRCVAAMHRNLSVENVLNTLEVVDTYSISNLKKVALKYLVTHRQDVKSQDEFKTLIAVRPHLVVEMIDIQDNIPGTLSYD